MSLIGFIVESGCSMETRISTCTRCGESDYRDSMCFYDGKPYCNICSDMQDASIIKKASTELEQHMVINAAPDLLSACLGAYAALSQHKTYPCDIKAAKTYLSDAIKKATI